MFRAYKWFRLMLSWNIFALQRWEGGSDILQFRSKVNGTAINGDAFRL